MNKPVFIGNGRTVTIDDVIEAAHFRGELDAVWREISKSTQDAAEGEEVDEASVQTASEQFRTERDLITAEETEQWLDARGLTTIDFSDFFVRHAMMESLPDAPASAVPDFSRATEEQRHLLRAELLLNGQFDLLATRLAWRHAALEAEGGDGARAGLDPLESAYERQSRRAFTPEALERTLQLLRIPLTGLELEILNVESRDAAREALLCLREDGLSMAEVARDGNYPLRAATQLLEELPEEIRQDFLCAAPGEVLVPFEEEAGVQICRVLQKIEPTLSDEAVRARVEQDLVARHFAGLSAKCVRWIAPFGGSL